MFRQAMVAVAIAACSGASPVEDARAALIRDTLIRGDQLWRVREPQLVAQKLATMATSRFAFLRGTNRLYWDDLQRGTPVESSTAYGSADAAGVMLVGDPHLENLGTFQAPTGEIVVDWNDFDSSTWGPYWGDARRLAVACYVAGLEIGRDDAGAAALAERAARGYAEEIGALSAGREAPMALGAYLDDLTAKAREDGDADKLATYTTVKDGVRTMRTGVIDPPIDGVTQDELVPLADADAAALARAIAAWPDTVWASTDRASLALVGGARGMARRLGAGVSSYPLYRWYAIVRGPTDAPDDDRLIELKEASDPVRLTGLPAWPPRTDRSNAERVVRNQRALHEWPDDDPQLGWTQLGELAIQVRSRTGLQSGVDVAKLATKVASGKYTQADVDDLATSAGRLLARAHARGALRDDRPALPVIAAALHGDALGFTAETAAFARAYGAQTENDVGLFRALLAADGPLLGGAP
ncbi:MAG: DUF2252 domain-containing protein [Deltaproteobacteria bacterium]|nr:DUF2252 domain-containing protein [Deltaproteobacteria bacterium]